MMLMFAQDARDQLKSYLAQMDDLRKPGNIWHTHKRPDGWHYDSLEGYVLQNGIAFTELAPARKFGPIKECFNNAFQRARRSPKLRYCEGYAISGRIPMAMLHAWCVDEKNRVVELTWRTPGLAYMGVIFPLAEVREARAGGNWSVLDNWQDGWPVMRRTPVEKVG